MSGSGHFRQIDRPTTLVSCPLRADCYRNSAPQRIDAECQQRTHARRLFEYSVGAQQERFGNFETDGLCSLEIDGQFELCRLLDGYVFWLSALQNSLYELGTMSKRSRSICPERH